MRQQRPDVAAGAPGRAPFPLQVVAAASSATAVANLPAFLMGALAHSMRAEMGYSTAGTGLAVSTFFLTSALAAPVLARFVQRAGPVLALRAGACTTAVALLSIAGGARSWPVLTGLLALAGVGNAVGQTAANLTIAELAQPGHDGLAFGVKQAAVPVATTFAGIAVPVFDSALGWRWAFGLGAAAAAAVALLAPRFAVRAAQTSAPARGRRRRSGPVDWPVVALVGAGAFLAAGISLGLAVYLVEFAVDSGWHSDAAGTLLAVASVLVVAVRILAGWWMDRRSRRGRPPIALLPAGLMMAAGAGGCLLLLAGGSSRAALVAGAFLGLGLGWGWAGLMHMTIVQLNRGAAATATGFILLGVFGGGVVLPSVLGLVVEHASYRAGWTVSAAGLAVASAALLSAHGLLRRRRLAG
jgi:MFS family permease